MKKIAVFPGHVGKDSGAIDPAATSDKLHTIEAVITNSIAQKVCHYLQDLHLPYQLQIGSFEARIAMTADCDAGVSIHVDSFSNPKIRGYHVIHAPKSIQGTSLANQIDSSMEVVATRARRVHGEMLHILMKTAFPCVLIECGFLSNPIDEGLLLMDHYQYTVAFAIVDGLRRWIYL